MSKFFSPIVYLLAVLYIPLYPLWGDHIHDPNYIFDTLPNGNRAPNPKRATNGAFLHLDNIKGSIRNPHQRLKAAIIDSSFSPEHTKTLMDKGVIHPAALQKLNPYALIPDEDFKTSSYYSNATNDVITTRGAFYKHYTKKGAKTHGSAVMEALHLMAPHASLLPIDLCIMSYAGYNKPSLTESQVLTKAIRAAITHHVDVINISRTMEDLDTTSLAAIKEAVNKGIAVVLAAGNSGRSSVFVSIWQTWNSIKKLWSKSKSQTLFEEVNGKGLLFAGALKYTPSGKEQVCDFTQLPEPVNGKNPHFILAPGEQLRLPIVSQSDRLTDGTSFAAPISSGAYLLLKQHAIEMGYSTTPEDILNIMEESGRNLTYKPPLFGRTKILKTLDVHAARILLDQKFKIKPPASYKPKPLIARAQRPIKPTMVKKPVPKVAKIKKPTAKVARVKKPAAKTPVVKKSSVKSKAKKKSSRKVTIAKKKKAPKKLGKRKVAPKKIKKTKRRKTSKRHRFARRKP